MCCKLFKICVAIFCGNSVLQICYFHLQFERSLKFSRELKQLLSKFHTLAVEISQYSCRFPKLYSSYGKP